MSPAEAAIIQALLVKRTGRTVQFLAAEAGISMFEARTVCIELRDLEIVRFPEANIEVVELCWGDS